MVESIEEVEQVLGDSEATEATLVINKVRLRCCSLIPLMGISAHDQVLENPYVSEVCV